MATKKHVVSRRCKAGEFALVTRHPLVENIGLIVLVVRPAGPNDSCNYDRNDPAWIVRSKGRDIIGRYADGSRVRAREWPVKDFVLAPLRSESECSA